MKSINLNLPILQVQALMEMIDSALNEANKIESRLDRYDEILLHVKDSIEKMAEKNMSIEQINSNNCKLLQDLDSLITQLELPSKYETALKTADLNKTAQLPQVIEAANALQTVINSSIPPHLMQMQAVKDQRKEFEKLRNKFSVMLSRHLSNLFIHLGNDPGETLSFHAEQLTLPKHTHIHNKLKQFAPLMHWQRNLDLSAFNALSETYTNSISKLYERDIRMFFEEAKQRISGGKRLRGSGSNQDLAGMSSVAGKITTQIKTRTTTSLPLLGVDRDLWGSELDVAERQKFDEIFERVLSELEPVCLSEQEFSIYFFNLNSTGSDVKSASAASTPGSSGSEEAGGVGDKKKGGKLVNKEVRAMMGALFTTLEQQLTSFINTFDRADS